MQPSRFRNSLLSLAIAAGSAIVASSPMRQERPKITGISHMAVYTSDPAAAEHFYGEELGAVKEPDPEDPRGTVYRLSGSSSLRCCRCRPSTPSRRLDHVAFATTDAAALHGYLVAHHYRDIDAVKTGSDGSKWFFTRDPEGNRVEFYQAAGIRFTPRKPGQPAHHPRRLSGEGSREGGQLLPRSARLPAVLVWRMHPGKVDWVSQQVPDGQDWLEYMMTGPGSDRPG